MFIQELIEASPVVMPLILACSILSLFIIAERLLHFHRARIDVPEFLRGLKNVLKRNNVVEAIAICEETPGPVAHVLRAAVLQCGKDEAALRQAVAEASLAEVPRLEKNLKMLATIGHLAPLLGLFGTVLGMIGLFQTMEEAGNLVATSDLAANIKCALVTTAAGLAVAIPTHGFYNLLVTKVQNLVLDMDKATSEIVYFLIHSDLKLDAADLAGADEPESQLAHED